MTRVVGQPAMTGQADDKAYATCGARKKQGPGTCTRPAGWGTDHPGFGQCKLHGGSTQSGTKAAAERQAIAAVETRPQASTTSTSRRMSSGFAR